MAAVNLVDLMSFPRPFLAEAKSTEVIWGLVVPFPHVLNRVTVQGPVISVAVPAYRFARLASSAMVAFETLGGRALP